MRILNSFNHVNLRLFIVLVLFLVLNGEISVISYIGLNNLFGRVATSLLRQSKNIKSLVVYDDKETSYIHLPPSKCCVTTVFGREKLPIALQAILVVASTPLNSILPVIASELEKQGVFEPKRLLGASSADTLRASTLMASKLQMNPSNVVVPVVGGCTKNTRVTLFSQSHPIISLNEKDQNEIKSQVEVFDQDPYDEPQIIERAYATVRFLHSVLAARSSGQMISELLMSRNDIVPSVEYFSLPVILGKDGIAKFMKLPKLSSSEEDKFEKAVAALKLDIKNGLLMANKSEIETREHICDKPEWTSDGFLIESDMKFYPYDTKDEINLLPSEPTDCNSISTSQVLSKKDDIKEISHIKPITINSTPTQSAPKKDENKSNKPNLTPIQATKVPIKKDKLTSKENHPKKPTTNSTPQATLKKTYLIVPNKKPIIKNESKEKREMLENSKKKRIENISIKPTIIHQAKKIKKEELKSQLEKKDKKTSKQISQDKKEETKPINQFKDQTTTNTILPKVQQETENNKLKQELTKYKNTNDVATKGKQNLKDTKGTKEKDSNVKNTPEIEKDLLQLEKGLQDICKKTKDLLSDPVPGKDLKPLDSEPMSVFYSVLPEDQAKDTKKLPVIENKVDNKFQNSTEIKKLAKNDKMTENKGKVGQTQLNEKNKRKVPSSKKESVEPVKKNENVKDENLPPVTKISRLNRKLEKDKLRVKSAMKRAKEYKKKKKQQQINKKEEAKIEEVKIVDNKDKLTTDIVLMENPVENDEVQQDESDMLVFCDHVTQNGMPFPVYDLVSDSKGSNNALELLDLEIGGAVDKKVEKKKKHRKSSEMLKKMTKNKKVLKLKPKVEKEDPFDRLFTNFEEQRNKSFKKISKVKKINFFDATIKTNKSKKKEIKKKNQLQINYKKHIKTSIKKHEKPITVKTTYKKPQVIQTNKKAPVEKKITFFPKKEKFDPLASIYQCSPSLPSCLQLKPSKRSKSTKVEVIKKMKPRQTASVDRRLPPNLTMVSKAKNSTFVDIEMNGPPLGRQSLPISPLVNVIPEDKTIKRFDTSNSPKPTTERTSVWPIRKPTNQSSVGRLFTLFKQVISKEIENEEEKRAKTITDKSNHFPH